MIHTLAKTAEGTAMTLFTQNQEASELETTEDAGRPEVEVTEWLSPTEICRELQIPLPTFYQWRSRGIGPHAYKIGRHVRVSRADLEAWIALRSET